MEVVYKAQGFKLSQELKDYTEKKIARLKKHFREIERAEVKFQVENNPRIKNGSKVEAILLVKGSLIKAKANSHEVFSAVDVLYEKLERQVEKYRTRVYASLARNNSKSSGQGKRSKLPAIKKRKQFIIAPMSEEEAQRRMENLNHDFFIFAKEDTSNICVLYRRKDGAFGLIEAILE